MAKDSLSETPPAEGTKSSPVAAGSEATGASQHTPRDSGAVIQIALAEFGKLRDEISGRSGAAWTLLGLNATVTSAVAGFVLAQKADPLLLLLLPLLTPSLGLLFIDHATNIGNIGEYIDKVLKPLLQEEAREPRLLCYEEWVDAFEREPIRRLLPFGIPLVLLFNVVPVAALLYTADRISTPWGWVLWALGVLMTAVQVAFWVALLAPPLRRALAKRSS
jgi:hypothetical protein